MTAAHVYSSLPAAHCLLERFMSPSTSMRNLLLTALLVLSACGDPSASAPGDVVAMPAEALKAVPLSDLQFNDYKLQEIATNLVREARARGTDAIPARHRIDGLLRLESSLGHTTAALERVNSLALRITAADSGEWAQLRGRAAVELNRSDDTSRRVQDLLARWQREKGDAALRHLSSNYQRFIGSAEWERRFYEFVSRRPMDAATWAWLILHYRREATQQHYGKADAELAYRLYLVTNGFAGADEARRTFSVPGIEIETAP
ncbi:MAG TPA: hypothetical protein VE010_10210 [Thermoanaerobaculia bacterium]|nr:hypothetical protein [Thermoanaerobaculia bacterium]